MYEFISNLVSLASNYGFSAVGACNLESISIESLQQWLSAGMNATMSYMQRNLPIRENPRQLFEGAESIIMFTAPYPRGISTPDGIRYAGFALGEDYHTVLKDALKDIAQKTGLERYRIFTDSAPILEREWAVKCGLGEIGMNNFLISYSAGPRVLLASIISDRIFSEDELQKMKERNDAFKERFPRLGKDICHGCGACISKCPNKALGGRGRLDARKCISYNTIETKTPPSQDINTKGWVLGCEECLNCCPYEQAFSPGIGRLQQKLSINREKLLKAEAGFWNALCRESFKETFSGTAFERPGLEKIIHNIRHISKASRQ